MTARLAICHGRKRVFLRGKVGKACNILLKVQKDVERGLVTIDGAKRYGVVLRDDLSIDEQSTAELREKMAASTATVEIFNRGGDIDQLKAECVAQTGLQPPEKPTFQVRL